MAPTRSNHVDAAGNVTPEPAALFVHEKDPPTHRLRHGALSMSTWHNVQRMPSHAQLVPYVIWQTWKDIHPRPLRFKGMNSIVQVR